eukprot:5882129-Amphidinium_carterae.1
MQSQKYPFGKLRLGQSSDSKGLSPSSTSGASCLAHSHNVWTHVVRSRLTPARGMQTNCEEARSSACLGHHVYAVHFAHDTRNELGAWSVESAADATSN